MSLSKLVFCMGLACLAVLAAAPGASAHIVVYGLQMDGPSEAPPNSSPGTGTGTVTFDLDLATMRVQVDFSGLTGNVTNAHIHAATAVPFAGTAGVATQLPSFTGFPAGATFGTYDNTFDMTLASSYNPTFVANNGGTIGDAFAALTNAAADGRAYFNIHTTTFGGGEIRGFLTAVPEPSSLMMLGLVSGPALMIRRRRKV